MAIEISGRYQAQPLDGKSEAKGPAGPTGPAVPNQQAAVPSTADVVTLTDTATRLHQLVGAVANVPIVDTHRVEGVRQSMLNGSFKIDSVRVAGKMMNFEQALNGAVT